MYSSNYSTNLELLSLDELRTAIHHLLDIRDEDVWMLFGTLPFYACSGDPVDLKLLERLYKSKNVTVRNDPDGRSRLNVNKFTGDIIVTDFGDIPVLGNIQTTSLQEANENWKHSKVAKEVSCQCPGVACLGPNILVKSSYYQNKDFTNQKAKIIRD